jgi:hypothetical protein
VHPTTTNYISPSFNIGYYYINTCFATQNLYLVYLGTFFCIITINTISNLAIPLTHAQFLFQHTKYGKEVSNQKKCGAI